MLKKHEKTIFNFPKCGRKLQNLKFCGLKFEIWCSTPFAPDVSPPPHRHCAGRWTPSCLRAWVPDDRNPPNLGMFEIPPVQIVFGGMVYETGFARLLVFRIFGMALRFKYPMSDHCVYIDLQGPMFNKQVIFSNINITTRASPLSPSNETVP